MGGLGAVDPGGAAAGQDAAQRVATDDLGDFLAAPERREVAQHSGRARAVVSGGTIVYSLGKAGRLGAPA